MEPGLVSVVIPVFRRPELLNYALASVLTQTYAQMEILVVDDASGEAFVRGYRIPPQGRLLQLAQNGGPSAARNAGLAEARGEWIAFLDSDDAWLPEKLALQVAIMRADPALSLTYCHFREVDADMRPLGTHPRMKAPHPDAFLACLRSPIVKTPSTVLMRRRILEETGGFDPALRYGEDRDLWLRAALCGPFQASPDPLVLYRVHPDQLTGPQHRLHNAEAEIRFMKTWASRLEKAPMPMRRMIRRALSSAYRGLAKCLMAYARDRAGATAALKQAWRAYPWDHRILLKWITLTLRRGTGA